MNPIFAVGLTLAAVLTVGFVGANSAPTEEHRDSINIRQLKELLHSRTQLAVLQLQLAKEIQERLSHLHPKTKRCVFGLPGAMDNCDLPDSGMQDIWDAGAGRRRAVLGGGGEDNVGGQQVLDALGNNGIWTDPNGAGKRGIFGAGHTRAVLGGGGEDNVGGQQVIDALGNNGIWTDPNGAGKRGIFGHGPGKRGTLLGLAGGSDNFDGQGALDARDQYELFNSGRTPGKRSHDRRR